MQLFSRVYEDIKRRRQKILDGKINCIPSRFSRFSVEWPGVEQGKLYGITAQQKVGKTQLADFMFLYEPFFFAFNNRDKMRLKIFYFSLEISAEEKYKQFLCHLLYILSKGKIRLSQRDLNSIEAGKPLSQEVLDILNSDEYKAYYEFFDQTVDIISHIRNPTGMVRVLKSYADSHGKWHKKMIDIEDNKTKEKKSIEVNDWYEPNDPDEYVIMITDHVSLMTTESDNGRPMTLHETISKFTSKYLIELRDDYKYIPVIIQQQALAGEGIENVKLGKLKPSVADLGDNKLTSRDVNIFFGIFSPYRHDIKQYMGYPIDKFKDHIRFLEIMISREGGGGFTCPLYFDGKVNFFKELPLPTDTKGIEKAIAMAGNADKDIEEINLFVINNNNKKKINGKNLWNFWNVWRWKDNINCD